MFSYFSYEFGEKQEQREQREEEHKTKLAELGQGECHELPIHWSYRGAPPLGSADQGGRSAMWLAQFVSFFFSDA